MTVDPETVVVATEPWFPGIMDAVRLAHAENGQHPLSLDKTAAIVWRGVTRQKAIIGVLGTPSLVKGMVVLTVDPVSYSDEEQILEHINFIRPDHRRSNYAKMLIKFAKHCSDEIGLDLMIGIISDTRLEAKRRLYERQLPIGGFWFLHRPRLLGAQAVVIEDGK